MVKNPEKAIQTLKQYFPNLKSDKFFRPTSNPTNKFNCIAWAMRLTDRWVDPITTAGHWWPCYHKEKNLDSSKEGLILAFEALKFKLCNDLSKEILFDKVALYYNPRTNSWTHAARILNENEFHSKIGEAWDIHHGSENRRMENHSNPDQGYGVIYKYMKRLKIFRLYSYWLILKAIFINMRNLIIY